RDDRNLDGVGRAAADPVAWQHQERVTISWLRAARLGEVHPPDLPVPDQRRFVIVSRRAALLRRRTAAAAGSSPGWPASAMTWFHDVVGSDGSRRLARYSRAASANRRLRDTRSRREHRSTSWKRSSGIEMAVFIV